MIKQYGISFFLVLIFFIGIGWCGYLISGSEITSRESSLLGILLVVLSTLATWVITHAYSQSQHKSAIKEVQEQHRANLRTYALNAAEKVNNLSSELNKLSIYLEQELDDTEYETPAEALRAREERLQSAIHIIRTLKSVNDTSLSDWEGVIGDELDQQREERQEKEEELRSVIERVESLIENQRQDFIGTQKDTESLRSEINRLKSELRSAAFQLSGTSIPKKSSRRQSKQTVGNKCPICSSPLEYRQRPSVRSVKSVICTTCGKKLISRYTEDGSFVLRIREAEMVTFECPKCGTVNQLPLDVFLGSNASKPCESCGRMVKVSRTIDGVGVKAVGPSQERIAEQKLSEDTLELVRKKLPDQPWPIGIHKEVAKDLGLPTALVSRAIQELIKRKIFNPQIDGTVYVPANTAKETTPTSDD